MIKKILFATDLGAFTSHSLIHVESLAKSYTAKVHVVHAVPPFGEFAAAVARSHCSERTKAELLATPDQFSGALETLREQIFEILARDSLADPELLPWLQDIRVIPGQPAAVILRESERINADLIVVGSHSMKALDGRILGSVAGKVLQLSRCPVFLVPMSHMAVATAGMNDLMPQRPAG